VNNVPEANFSVVFQETEEEIKSQSPAILQENGGKKNE